MTNNKTLENKKLVTSLVVFATCMLAFAFVVLPPLYDVFCEVTGLGGRTNTSAADIEDSTEKNADLDRSVQLEFVTTVNGYAPWEFSAEIDGMTIHPGKLHEAFFLARNLSDQHKTAQAVPSVAPPQAAKYFKKLECFCFTSQAFEAGEEIQMPVRFIVDSDLPDYIDTITLSYTFFDTARVSQADAPLPTNTAH